MGKGCQWAMRHSQLSVAGDRRQDGWVGAKAQGVGILFMEPLQDFK